jgi:hypothetical protein
MWSVEFLDEIILAEMQGQPNDIKAKFEHIVRLIEANGLERVREPYIKHLALIIHHTDRPTFSRT